MKRRYEFESKYNINPERTSRSGNGGDQVALIDCYRTNRLKNLGFKTGTLLILIVIKEFTKVLICIVYFYHVGISNSNCKIKIEFIDLVINFPLAWINDTLFNDLRKNQRLNIHCTMYFSNDCDKREHFWRVLGIGIDLSLQYIPSLWYSIQYWKLVQYRFYVEDETIIVSMSLYAGYLCSFLV